MEESRILEAIADLNTKIEAMQKGDAARTATINALFEMVKAAGQNNVVADARIDELKKLNPRVTRLENRIGV